MDSGAPDPNLRELRLRDYRPRPALCRPLSQVPRALHPAVDAHAHLGRWLGGRWAVQDVGSLLSVMNECGVAAIVNLDGMWGEELDANLERYDRAHPGRFATFAQWDRSLFAVGDGFGERLGALVRDAILRGAKGLKVWKDLGLHLRDAAGGLVMPDDARLDPVWDACVDGGVPVLIHTGDPIAFFQPLDPTNERLEELLENPDWWFGDRSRFPSFERLAEAFEGLVSRWPDVTFIGAHAAGSAEDLDRVAELLSTYPNLHVDIAARIAELGRVPRAARGLILQHPDRFLFGTDGMPPDQEQYEIHFRFLETSDEYFEYAPDEVPPQGRWAISGLEVPPRVLEALYGGNARRLIPGLGGR